MRRSRRAGGRRRRGAPGGGRRRWKGATVCEGRQPTRGAGGGGGGGRGADSDPESVPMPPAGAAACRTLQVRAGRAGSPVSEPVGDARAPGGLRRCHLAFGIGGGRCRWWRRRIGDPAPRRRRGAGRRLRGPAAAGPARRSVGGGRAVAPAPRWTGRADLLVGRRRPVADGAGGGDGGVADAVTALVAGQPRRQAPGRDRRPARG